MSRAAARLKICSEDGKGICERMTDKSAGILKLDTGKKYVTVTEAARHLRVSRNTIYDACRDNEMDFIKVRSSLRVLINFREKYMTVAETAVYLNMSPSTVYEACSLSCDYGQLPHLRVRSRIRIPYSKLIHFAAAGSGAGGLAPWPAAGRHESTCR